MRIVIMRLIVLSILTLIGSSCVANGEDALHHWVHSASPHLDVEPPTVRDVDVMAVLPNPTHVRKLDLLAAQETTLRLRHLLTHAAPFWFTIAKRPEDAATLFEVRGRGKAYNKTFHDFLRSGAKVMPIFQFDEKDFPKMSHMKQALGPEDDVNDLVAAVANVVVPKGFDGLFLDFGSRGAFGLPMKAVMQSLVAKLREVLTKELEEHARQKNWKKAGIAYEKNYTIGLLLNDGVASVQEYVWLSEVVDIFLINASTVTSGEVANVPLTYPSPSFSVAEQAVKRLVPKAGTPKQHKADQSRMFVILSLEGALVNTTSQKARILRSRRELLSTLDQFQTDTLQSQWNEQISEYELTSVPGSDLRLVVPSPKGLVGRVQAVKKMKQNVAFFGLQTALQSQIEVLRDPK